MARSAAVADKMRVLMAPLLKVGAPEWRAVLGRVACQVLVVRAAAQARVVPPVLVARREEREACLRIRQTQERRAQELFRAGRT